MHAAIEARQLRAFDLRVQGVSMPAIAKLLGVGRDTIAADVLLESQRRFIERATDRQTDVERSLSLYDSIISATSLQIAESQRDIAASTGHATRATHRATITRDRQLLLRAARQAEETAGLHSKMEVTVHHANANAETARIIAAFKLLPPDERAEIRVAARERREVRARESGLPLPFTEAQ